MKKSRFTPKRVVTILMEFHGSKSDAEVCRDHGISQPTLYNWRKKYGGMNGEELKRLKDLEAENHRLKQMYTELALDSTHSPQNLRGSPPILARQIQLPLQSAQPRQSMTLKRPF